MKLSTTRQRADREQCVCVCVSVCMYTYLCSQQQLVFAVCSQLDPAHKVSQSASNSDERSSF